MRLLSDETIRYLLGLYRKNVGEVIDIEEFKEDVRRFVYVQRILRRYKNYRTINARLLLNHILILYNVFGDETTSILIRYVDKDLQELLYGSLHYIYRLPPDLIKYACVDIQNVIQEDIDGRTEVQN